MSSTWVDTLDRDLRGRPCDWLLEKDAAMRVDLVACKPCGRQCHSNTHAGFIP